MEQNNKTKNIDKKIGRYILSRELGDGAYGTVYLARDEKDSECKEVYALKKFKIKKGNEKSERNGGGVPKTALREVCLLKELDHINIEKLIDVLHIQMGFSLVFEYIETDLGALIAASKGKILGKKRVKSLMYQILKGIAYLHKCQIVHRDLKPQNLLMTKDDIIKIADFGLARGYNIATSNMSEQVVTLFYRSPDVLLGNINYSTDIDIWSIGVIFAEMVGCPLFTAAKDEDVLSKICYKLGVPNENTYPGVSSLANYKKYIVDKDLKAGKKNLKDTLEEKSEYLSQLEATGVDLICKMLQINPNDRISAKDALAHPYFNDIDKETLALYKNEKEEL